jgi:hypothetical protein
MQGNKALVINKKEFREENGGTRVVLKGQHNHYADYIKENIIKCL